MEVHHSCFMISSEHIEPLGVSSGCLPTTQALEPLHTDMIALADLTRANETARNYTLHHDHPALFQATWPMGASNGTGPERAEILAPKHGRHAWNAVWLEPHYGARLGKQSHVASYTHSGQNWIGSWAREHF